MTKTTRARHTLRIKDAEEHLADLAGQRVKFAKEMPFYEHSAPPDWVRTGLEDNDVQVAGAQNAMQNLRASVEDANAKYDKLLSRLRPLWKQKIASKP